ncbi:growth hormone-regulated TBC protein 1-A-like [Rhodnius prolixus]|uniref:Growth hormone-regulated TBC protein 1 n=2 Tax=Rhodnius TaxID=13248 RepID=R4FNZ6_RHOPR
MSSNFSKVDEYGFERPDDFDYTTYESFMSQYLKILAKRSRKWTRAMTKQRLLRKPHTLKREIRKGIPNEHREKIWLYVSGAADEMNLNVGLYQKLLNSKHDTTLTEMIRTDLPRTFPDNIFFNSGDEYQEQLFRVLVAYGHHNKVTGYCQGMNYIAGLLLLVTKSEESTFWLLKTLVERILPDYYSNTMDGLLTDIDVISELVSSKYPAVNAHLSQLGLPWPVVLTKWLVCLYCEVLPTETVLRIWDCLFNEGSKILLRVAITLIALHKSEILACDQFLDVSDCLKAIVKGPNVIHCHKFLKNIFKVPGKISSKQISRLRETIAANRITKNKNERK